MSDTSLNDQTSVDVMSLPVHPGPVLPGWTAAATAQGFAILARIEDRLHLALRCPEGHVFKCRIYTLVRCAVQCSSCLNASRAALAASVGLQYLGRDPDSTQYGLYRAGCGHEQRRQYDYVRRMADGHADIRCGICFAVREARIAVRHGWTRVCPNPEGNPNYHLYDHACGQRQRIARANMGWGQVSCAGCGGGWNARESRIYLIQMRLGSRHLLKLGYSAHPTKRHRHQLGLPKDMAVRILREVPMPSGHAARAAEARLHRDLRSAYPDDVVPRTELAHWTNVVSEIYRPRLRGEIEARLDALEAPAGSGGSESPAAPEGQDTQDVADPPGCAPPPPGA